MKSALSRREVLKGCSRSVVVVHAPGPLFDQAIFLLRDELLEADSVQRRRLLRQAEEAAGRQAAALSPARFPLMPVLLGFVPGCALGLLSGLLLL